MMQKIDQRMAHYGPIYHKGFGGALDAFFQQECPQLGGSRTRQVLVQSIAQMVDAYFPVPTRMRQGQIMWAAVAKDEAPGYGKHMLDLRQVPVVLDLVLEGDALAIGGGKSFQSLREETIARLYQQAFDQGGCLATADLAMILKLCPTCTAPDCLDQRLASCRLLGFPIFASLVGRAPAKLFEPPRAVV